MSQENRAVKKTMNSANNVEEIRDIIFGSQIKIFESKFEKLDIKLLSMEKELREYFKVEHRALKVEMERSFMLLQERLNGLDTSMQEERLREKEIINRRDIQVQKQFKIQNEAFIRKFNLMKEYIEENKKAHQDKLERVESTMKEELERVLSTLSQEKVSRASMSEMFLDIAMRLQDSSMNEVLRQGIETGK
jgi:formate dehydrogenase maturation protein FdhE